MGKKDKPKQEVESFWTVLVSEVRLQKGRYRVKGHFAYVSLRIVSGVKRISLSWLTPEDEPFEFDLPPALFPNKRFDRIAPLDVELRFIELFDRVPVATIPEAPISLPLEKLPPRKRRRALLAAKKKREKQIWNPPSVE
jgi:hypothetical protein